MPLYLTNGTPNLIEFEQGLPPSFKGPFLQGSMAMHAVKDSCQLIIQEIITEFYSLRLNVFQFFQKLSIDCNFPLEGLHIRTLLKGAVSHELKDAKNIYLHEGEFAMLWARSAECRAGFQKDNEYRTLDIFYSPRLIEQLYNFYPELISNINTSRQGQLVGSPFFITPAMRDIIRQVLECPFDDATRQLYFDIKVREILYVMLEHVYKRKPPRYHFTVYEMACIQKAHDLLLEDVSKKPQGIRQLARRAGLNEFKLKAGFKHVFGMGIFECLQEARMEKARELLLSTNKPVKEICRLAGYPRITNFITAFRRKFGYTPGSLRRG